MRILRWLGIALVVLLAALVGIGVVARFSDGPIGPLPGGPLRAGSLVTEPDVDWSFAKGVEYVEFQLVEPPRSRTTGILVHDGQLYVPADLGFLAEGFPAPTRWMLFLILRYKRWHEEALRDGRVVLRIDGKRYERQAVRVTDPKLFAALSSLVTEKAVEVGLDRESRGDPDAIWFFRMEPSPPT